MSKSKVFLALAGFVFAGAMAFDAQAKPKDKDKDCPGDWDRVRVNKSQCEHEARKIDKNGNDDNWVCEKYKYGNIKYRDNKKQHDW
jgi:hypothetical protein